MRFIESLRRKGWLPQRKQEARQESESTFVITESHFPMAEVARANTLSGRNWEEYVPLHVPVSLEAIVEPVVQVHLGSTLVRGAIDTIEGNLDPKVASQTLSDGRVIGFIRNVKTDTGFKLGAYVIDPTNDPEVHEARYRSRSLQHIDAERVSGELDKWVNFFPSQEGD